jgi:nucleoid-associated protein YgaU
MRIDRVTMMDPGVKIAAASCVLLAGIFVALLFRHHAPSSGPAVPGRGDRLVLRKQSEPLAGQPAPGGHESRSPSADSASAAAQETGQPATVLTPTDRAEAPPALARDYPRAGAPGTSGWGGSIELPVASRADGSVRTHRIVDGDTLEALAERYLGSTDRSLEIYEANRDVLPSPGLLPIGAELRIPSARRAPPPSGLMPERPSVRIPRRPL